MNFFQARAVAKSGLYVRRAAWTTQWFIVWRGVWFGSFAGVIRPVLAADYTADDLTATDWTPVPAPLAACPVDTAIGSTGGAPPDGRTYSFSYIIPLQITFGTYTPGVAYFGYGGSVGTLPPPDTGQPTSVTFDGFALDPAWTDPIYIHDVNVNGTYAVRSVGHNTWESSNFMIYHLDAIGGSAAYDAIVKITVTRFGSDFEILVTGSEDWSGDTAQPLGRSTDMYGGSLLSNAPMGKGTVN